MNSPPRTTHDLELDDLAVELDGPDFLCFGEGGLWRGQAGGE